MQSSISIDGSRKRQRSSDYVPSVYKSGGKVAPLLRDIGKTSTKRSPSPTTFKTSNFYGILDTPRSNLKLNREKENKTYSRGGPGKVTRSTRVEPKDTWIDNTNDPEYALNLVKENRSPVPPIRQPRRSLFSDVRDLSRVDVTRL